ncbi:ALP1-like protein isoform X1 [Tanacetum coccineum]
MDMNSKAIMLLEVEDLYAEEVEVSRHDMNLFNIALSIMENFRPEYLRRPTPTNVEKLYTFNEQKHEFPRTLRSLDCTYWEWFGCPIGYKAKYCIRDHGLNPFILLEVVASQDLWIWHDFFGVFGANNDINAIHQSLLLNDIKQGKAPEILFVANVVIYLWGYYLCDGIYPEWVTFVKSVSNLAEDDHKRIQYK